MIDTIRRHLEALMLPPDAQEWLLGMWQAIQVFDDFADGDTVERKDLDGVIWNTLIAMPCNPFFQQHSAQLGPLVSTMVLKWQASDAAERAGNANAQSYMWRAGFYELILMCVQLTHGPAAAMAVSGQVLGLYGESLDDYLKEFGNA